MTQTPKSRFVIPVRRPLRRRILKAVNLTVQLAVVASLTLSGGFGAFTPSPALAISGAIWTTTGSCGADPQDANHYNVGDHVFINASGFDPNPYSWNIDTVPPSTPVASGTQSVEQDGTTCFDAYTIQPGDSGEYKATFADGKHDNYRVVTADSTISGTKWFDGNHNGQVDEGDFPLADWTIVLKSCQSELGDECEQIDSTTTDQSGHYTLPTQGGLSEGSYFVCEVVPPGWYAVNTDAGIPYDEFYCKFVEVDGSQSATGVDFFNYDNVHALHGQKWNDADGNGLRDDEGSLNGWTIFLDGNGNGQLDAGETSMVTTEGGWYWFSNLRPDTYSVCEVPQAGWAPTYPQNDNHNCHTITVPQSQAGDTCEIDQQENEVWSESMCSFGNQEQTSVTVLKNVDVNGDGDTTDPGDILGATDWTWDVNGGNQNYTTGSTQTVVPGSITVNEDLQTGYHFTSVSCNVNEDSFEVTQGASVTFETFTGGHYTCTFTNTVTPTPPNLTIAKTDNRTTANPGEVLTYQITVTNTGTLSANGVRITDTVPNFVTNVTGISDSGVLAANLITWDNLTIPGNGSKTVTFDGTVSPSIPAGTTVLHNIALLGCTEFQGCPYLGTATDDTSVTVVAPTLSITKTNNSGSFVNPGATVTYTVVVSNSSSATQDAQNVVLSDVLPAGFTYTVGGGSTKSFTLGTINPGASVTTTYAATVSSSQTAGTYANTASASASNATTVSATSGVVVRVPAVLGVQSPDLSIQKSSDSTFANPGDTLTYTIEVKNVGTSSVVNVVVTDTLPNHFAFTDSSGSTRTWNLGTIAFGKSVTFTYTVAVNVDATNGTYTNTATVTADGVNPRTDTVDVDVRVPQVLGIATTGPSSFDYALLSLGVLLVAFGAFLLRREHRTNRAGVSPSPRA